MKLLVLCSSLILAFFFSGAAYAQNDIIVLDNQARAEDRIQIGISNPVQVTEAEFERALVSIPDSKDLIISTDSAGILSKFVSKIKVGGKGLRQAIALGPLLQLKKDQFREAGKNNKIGLTVVTINLAYDSYIWLHATEHSPEVRAAQMIFSTLMALTFSIDTNVWSRTSHRLKGKLLSVFSPAALEKINSSKLKQFGFLFGANLIMSVGVSGSRYSILAYDHAINLPYILQASGVALAVGTITTVGQIGWSEFSAGIDRSKNPYAKFIARRVSEARSLTMGYFANSSKIMQPGAYGYQPWLILALSGTTGLAAMIHSKTIVPFLEKRARKVTNISIADAVVKVGDKISSIPARSFGAPLCRGLYKAI